MLAIGDNGRQLTPGLPANSPSRPDRPFISVDNVTGTVYVSVDDFAIPGVQRYVAASHDNGLTFGPARQMTTDAYPGTGGDTDTTNVSLAVPSAGSGRLAFAYQAGAAPNGYTGVNGCPCPIFETSRDDGITWDQHSAPFAATHTAADPSHPGHYAIMALDGSSVEVSRTTDYGVTWSKPTLIGNDPGRYPFQPWIAYSPDGVLGLGYKYTVSDWSNGLWASETDGALSFNTTFDYWAAVSADGGVTFSPSVRISHAVSPADSAGDIRDDFSFVMLDNRYLYTGWGDLRTSPTDPSPAARSIYFGRIDLEPFQPTV
ncbi:sialidase family protein [Streptomyces mirabilis]|nr:sialidase family protein [Streptomyces mirabilis]